jgi:hypothetical protein
MKQHTALNWLVPIIAIIALVMAGVGIFSGGGNDPRPFTTIYGNSVELYGTGIYSHDSSFVATLMKGTDMATLFIAVPLLLIGYSYYRRGSLRGSLFMTGMLTYFLYVGVTYTFSVIFNSMFLFYVALFSTSIFATILAFATFDMASLVGKLTPSTPRKGMAIFLIVAGLSTFMLWLSELIGPLMTGTAPANLGPYTTMFTHGFDSAIITPACVIAGIYLLRKESLGYLFAVPLLILCTLMGVAVISQTITQALNGIIFPVGVYIGMVGSWVVMGAFAIGLSMRFFRSIS